MLKKMLLSIFLFTMPLMMYLGNTNFSATKTPYSIVFISVLWVSWLIARFRRPETPITLTRLFLPFLAILAAMGLSLVNSINLNLSLVSIVIASCFFLLLLIIANTVQSKRDLFLLIGSLTFAAMIASGYGLLQYYGQVAAHPNPRIQSELILSTMGNKNFLGEFLAFLIYPSLALFLLSRSRWLKLILLFGQVVMYMTMLAIDSDAVWLALVGATLFFFICIVGYGLFEPLKRNRGWLLGLVIVAATGALWLSAPAPWNALPGLSQRLTQQTVFPLAGDWDKDGQDAVGLYVTDSQRFDMARQRSIQFQQLDELVIPVAGDWDGDGHTDIGIYASGRFSWDLDLDGHWDVTYLWGKPDNWPVVGDWNGDGLVDNGAYDFNERAFVLAREEKADASFILPAQQLALGDWPLAGDWNGDGRDELAFYRAVAGTFWLDPAGQGRFDHVVPMQQSEAADVPVVGNLQGKAVLGLFRPASRMILWDDDLDGQPDRVQPWGEVSWQERGVSWLKPSMWIRLEDWAIAWEMWREQPWLGAGVANFQLKFLPSKAKLLATPWGQSLEAVEQNPAVGYIPRAAHAHNEYVHFTAETGLAGALALVFAMFCVIRYGRRTFVRQGNRSQEVRLVGLSLFSGLVAIFLDGLVGFPLYLPATGLVFVMLLGTLFSSYFQKRQVEFRAKRNTKQVLTLAGMLFASLVVLVAVRDFMADVKVQEGLRFYTTGYTHLGARRFKQSLGLAMTPQVSLQFLGGYYSNTNLYKECIHYNEEALRALPTEQAYWDLSQCYSKQENYDLAFYYLKLLVAVDPEDRLKQDVALFADALYNQVWERWKEGDARAVQWLDDLASIAAANHLSRQTQFEADYRRAMIRMESDDEQGIALLVSLIEAYPDHSLAYLGLGQSLRDQVTAKRYIQKSLSLMKRQEILSSQSSAPQAKEQLKHLAQWQFMAEQALLTMNSEE